IAFFSVHPGFVRTRFGLNNPGPVSWLIRFLGFFFAIRPDQGARTPMFGAASPELAGKAGLYLDGGRVSVSSAASRDLDAGTRLWDVLMAMDQRTGGGTGGNQARG